MIYATGSQKSHVYTIRCRVLEGHIYCIGTSTSCFSSFIIATHILKTTAYTVLGKKKRWYVNTHSRSAFSSSGTYQVVPLPKSASLNLLHEEPCEIFLKQSWHSLNTALNHSMCLQCIYFLKTALKEKMSKLLTQHIFGFVGTLDHIPLCVDSAGAFNGQVWFNTNLHTQLFDDECVQTHSPHQYDKIMHSDLINRSSNSKQ